MSLRLNTPSLRSSIYKQLVGDLKNKSDQSTKKPLMEKSHGLISSLGVWGSLFTHVRTPKGTLLKMLNALY